MVSGGGDSELERFEELGAFPDTTISSDPPLYRSLAALSELYDNTRLKVHAMIPTQKEQEVDKRPEPKSKPDMPVANPEKDIVRYDEDEPASKPGLWF